jgi:hypothetical protein
MTDPDDLDEELALLLPFYANGTLAAADSARVTAALEHSAALRSELAAVRSVQTLVQRGGAQFEVADEAETSARLETMLERIDAEALPQHVAAKRSAATIKPGFWAVLFSFHWQPTLAMAVAALVLVQSGTIGYFATRDTPARYGSLSGPDTATPRAAILLQFKTGARWYDIQTLMMRADMYFVSGPADGVVGVAPNKPKTASEIAALIAHLRVSPIVSFAGAAE